MHFFGKAFFLITAAIVFISSGKCQTRSFSSAEKKITVLLDSYFNNEKAKDKSGNMHSVHYKWDQRNDGGYSIWGDTFRQYGAEIKTTYDPPSEKTLQNASVYIITDPDIPAENPNAKYMTETYADAITKWVAKGGVLILMANDSGNADIHHFNLLAQKFGVLFNEDSYNHVPGRNFDSGAINIKANNDIFKNSKRVYIKELSTIHLLKSVKTVLEKKGHIIAVTAHVDRGVVFAVGDPWFYNEYVNGKKLPASFQNVLAMQELTLWLIHEARKNM